MLSKHTSLCWPGADSLCGAGLQWRWHEEPRIRQTHACDLTYVQLDSGKYNGQLRANVILWTLVVCITDWIHIETLICLIMMWIYFQIIFREIKVK